MIPDALFDPTHYSTVRLPVLEASTLPAWCYTSDAFFERERERAFAQGWQFVGRTDEVSVGGYLSVETVGGPILLLKDTDGTLRAFANTCRHRGARLTEGSDTCVRLVCPYHAWSYRLDGSLAGAPGMDATTGFDPETHGLTPIRMAVWAGFVFVCYSQTTPDLQTYFGDMTQRLGSHRFEDFVCVRKREYDVAANWKLIAENAMEAYHTGSVHGASLGQQTARDLETSGHWDSIQVLQETSIAVLPGEQIPFAQVEGLSQEAAAGTYFTTLHPNTQFACVQDSMWWMNYRPIAANRTIVQSGQCFPRSTVERADFEQGAAPYFLRWDTGIDEDNIICQAQQAGLSSLLHKPGRLSERETRVHSLNNWILDQVLDEDHAPAPHLTWPGHA